MKKFIIHSHARQKTVAVEADQMFWNGTSVVFVRGGNTIAVVSLLPGDLAFDDAAINSTEEQHGPFDKPKEIVN